MRYLVFRAILGPPSLRLSCCMPIRSLTSYDDPVTSICVAGWPFTDRWMGPTGRGLVSSFLRISLGHSYYPRRTRNCDDDNEQKNNGREVGDRSSKEYRRLGIEAGTKAVLRSSQQWDLKIKCLLVLVFGMFMKGLASLLAWRRAGDIAACRSWSSPISVQIWR